MRAGSSTRPISTLRQSFLVAFGITVTLSSLGLGGASVGHGAESGHHGMVVARRGSAIIRESGDGVEGIAKRGFSGRATFYDVGLGACGKYNSDSEFVVALNQPQWAGGSMCGKQITISLNGKSHGAKIVDLCPGCPWGALDMSPALFNYFSNPDAGVFYMSWSVGGGDDEDPPKSSYSPTPTPTSSSAAPSSSSASSSSSSAAPSASASANTTTTQVVLNYEPGQNVLQDISRAVIGIGAVVANAAGAMQAEQ